eukprot:CAMPEP_0197457772 /NCGR_PEP_ID=MMETSP1175-20131217/46985_1 /TAXON_ID=1003142 /ORGANISM="Triceratium dubium, Strain CCMP147" /LENGTH=56 /DNA_ID=CAMNT_0042992217 /DNA_START=1 /DNA_END=168 /DNA_ORIENTATION=+
MAEAVRPGRPYTGGYGSTGCNLGSGKEVMQTFIAEIQGREEACEPLTRPRSALENK